MADPLFVTIAKAVHAALVTILSAEGRATPDLVFGNVPIKQGDPLVRISWTHAHGSFLVSSTLPAGTPVTDPPTTPLMQRRAIALIRFWNPDKEAAEHELDRIVLATRRTAYQANFQWQLALYQYPSDRVGAQLQNGVEVLTLTVPIDLPMTSYADGEFQSVEILDTQLRAGQEDVLDTTTPGQPEFQLSEWT
jgi:hypothetical protein